MHLVGVGRLLHPVIAKHAHTTFGVPVKSEDEGGRAYNVRAAARRTSEQRGEAGWVGGGRWATPLGVRVGVMESLMDDAVNLD